MRRSPWVSGPHCLRWVAVLVSSPPPAVAPSERASAFDVCLLVSLLAEVMSEISQNNRSIMAITINWLFCDSGSVWCQNLPWSFLLLRDFRIVLFHFLCKSIHSYMVHTGGGGDLGSLESIWKIKKWNIDCMMFMCAHSCMPMHMWLFSPAFLKMHLLKAESGHDFLLMPCLTWLTGVQAHGEYLLI